MSRERRREMVDREHPALSTLRQCALMGISRSSVYYRPRAPSPKGPGTHEADRPAVPGHALLRVAAHEGLAGQARPPGKPEEDPTADAGHGSTGHIPAPPYQPARTWAQGASVSARRHGVHPAQPGVGSGYHLRPDGPGLPLPGGHHGLVQPLRGGLEAVQHHGR